MDPSLMTQQVVLSSKSSLMPFALYDRAKVLCGFVDLAIVALEAPSISEILVVAGWYLAYERTFMSILMPSARRLAHIEQIKLDDLLKF
jgi:hypothetical protein